VFEMGCLRKIIGVTRRDRKRNEDVRVRPNMHADVVQRIAEKRLKYFGYVMRMHPHRLPNIAHHGEVHGKRIRERPKKRWIDNVKEDLESVGVARGEGFSWTRDREGWRLLCFITTV